METPISRENNPKESLIQKFKLFSKCFFRKDFFKSTIVRWLLILNFSANLANWLILFIFIRRVDDGIILHYNVYFGVDSTGNFAQVYLMPVVGLMLFALNSSLAVYFYGKKERIASHILMLSSLMVQFSLIIASVGIIIINY